MNVTAEIFLKYLQTTDNPVFRILVLHLSIENRMDNIFGFYFRDSRQIRTLSFATKVRILSATGLAKPELIKNLRLINELRNYIAHNLVVPHSKLDKIIGKIHFNFKKGMSLNEKLELILVENSVELESITNCAILKGK